MSIALPPHVRRVLERLRERDLNPRPRADDDVGWDVKCPVCDGWMVVRDVNWEDGNRRMVLICDCFEDEILRKLSLQAQDLIGYASDLRTAEAATEMVVVTIEAFAAEDEQGAGAILGTEDEALIPEGGDVMIYGDGGAGKTTLAVDLTLCLATGREWLGIPVPKPVSVLLIENEGPRPMFRRKLRRKLKAWGDNNPVDGRIHVLEHPWGKFSFGSEEWREELSLKVAAWKIDVIIAGPLTRIGMNEAGTLQQVNAFMELVADLRERCGRPLVVILIHHESKAGSVSGAWEGSGDTLLHVEAAGNGHTILFVQKARWDRERQGVTMRLQWAAGDTFELEGDRDILAELKVFVAEHPWRTVTEIASPKERGGIGANRDVIKGLLEGNPDEFESRTGDAARAVGRAPKATVWNLLRPPEQVEQVGGLHGPAQGHLLTCSNVVRASASGQHNIGEPELAQTPEQVTSD